MPGRNNKNRDRDRRGSNSNQGGNRGRGRGGYQSQDQSTNSSRQTPQATSNASQNRTPQQQQQQQPATPARPQLNNPWTGRPAQTPSAASQARQPPTPSPAAQTPAIPALSAWGGNRRASDLFQSPATPALAPRPSQPGPSNATASSASTNAPSLAKGLVLKKAEPAPAASSSSAQPHTQTMESLVAHVKKLDIKEPRKPKEKEPEKPLIPLAKRPGTIYFPQGKSDMLRVDLKANYFSLNYHVPDRKLTEEEMEEKEKREKMKGKGKQKEGEGDEEDTENELFFYLYEISFMKTPEAGGDSFEHWECDRTHKRRLITYLLNMTDPSWAACGLTEAHVATDYQQHLVTTKPIFNGIGYHQFDSIVDAETGLRAVLEITLKDKLPPAHFVQMMRETGNVGTKDNIIKILNMIFTKYANSKSDGLKRSSDRAAHPPAQDRFFHRFNQYPQHSIFVSSSDKNQANKIFVKGTAMELRESAHTNRLSFLMTMRGFFASVRPSVYGFILNLNVCTSAFFHWQRMSNILRDIAFDERAKFLKGLKVRTNYAGNGRTQRRKCLRIGPSWDQLQVPYQGNNISMRDYYMQVHAINLADPNYDRIGGQPDTQRFTIEVRKDPRVPVEHKIYIPASLCYLDDIQPYKGALPPAMQANMIANSKRIPQDNKSLVEGEGITCLGYQDQSWLNQFNLSISTSMLRVNGVQLPAPIVTYGRRVIVDSRVDRSGRIDVSRTGSAWNLGRVKEFYKDVGRFTIKYFCLVKTEPEFQTIKEMYMAMHNEFISKFPKLVAATQMITPTTLGFPASNTKWTNDQIQQVLTKLKEKKPADIYIVFFSEYDVGTEALYSAVKIAAELRLGIKTVCVKGKKLSLYHAKEKRNGLPGFCANIAMKICLKMGGMPHVLTKDSKTNLKMFNNNAMLVGIDVTHPSPDSALGAASTVGVVATIDQDYVKYIGRLGLQNTYGKGSEEYVQDLESIFKDILLTYMKFNNKALPEKIVIYRDGVGESQYQDVMRLENPQIDAAIREVYEAAGKRNMPKVSLLVVGKRHHTRFYLRGPANEALNCIAGTVVDNGVTQYDQWDFFLQTHKAIQGTARPAHYIALREDDREATTEAHAKAINGLAYLFGRAPVAPSVATPAYYADMLCERGRTYLRDMFHYYPELQKKPQWQDEDEKIQQSNERFQCSREFLGDGLHENVKDTMFWV